MAQDQDKPNAQERNPSSSSSGRGQSGYGYGYGSGYGGYGYGGGYGGYGGAGGYGGGGGGVASSQPTRTFKDYLLILRERIWYFVVVFFIIFTGTVLYTIQSTPIYRSAAKIQILRDAPSILKTPEIENTTIRGTEDFNTQVEVLNSMRMVSSVADRIKDDERRRLMAPYENRIGGGLTLPEVLARNRRILSTPSSLMVNILYDHPDAVIAAMVANYFADEYITYTIRESIDTSMGATEDLRVRAENQKATVERLRAELGDYVRKYEASSLNQGENIKLQQLLQISSQLAEDKRNYDVAATQWQMIESAEASGTSLLTVSFISQSPRISELVSRRSQLEIDLASLRRRYRDKHPSMMEAVYAYEQTQSEIEKAIAIAVENARTNLAQAQNNYEQSQKRLAEKDKEVMALNELAIRYRTLEDDLRINNDLYSAMMASLNVAETKVNIVKAQARLIDRAFPPMEPYSPNILKNLAVGAFLGIIGGLGVVFGIAFLDDRIKTVQDIEEAVGLPLVGVVPRIKRLNSAEKAQAVASNAEQRITESFRAIHSALRLNELSKKAKIILTTSTSPSEGKSFVTTNLAITFAIHGERTLVIDADLRMPSIGKSLNLEGDNGLVKYLAGNCTFEEALLKDFYPNLDVLPAGQKAKNPTQILNSHEFLTVLEQLSTQYDRIFIDTPPLAVVSDVLSLLPHADGLLYVIKYNSIKRKSARANLRRIIDSQTPVFGAVLNQISLSVANYYYASYYDKSYAKYYSTEGGTSVRLRGQGHERDEGDERDDDNHHENDDVDSDRGATTRA